MSEFQKFASGGAYHFVLCTLNMPILFSLRGRALDEKVLDLLPHLSFPSQLSAPDLLNSPVLSIGAGQGGYVKIKLSIGIILIFSFPKLDKTYFNLLPDPKKLLLFQNRHFWFLSQISSFIQILSLRHNGYFIRQSSAALRFLPHTSHHLPQVLLLPQTSWTRTSFCGQAQPLG